MLDQILDDLDIDELDRLRNELNDFFNSYNAYQWAYCEGLPDADAINETTAERAKAVRERIKGLAIDWGIHKEFLKQYEDLRQTIAKKALESQPDLAAF